MEFTNSQVEFFNGGKVVMLIVLQNDMPIVIPIWGMLYKDAVYMTSDSDPLKLDLINQDSKVSATVVQNPPGWPWFRIEGKATTDNIDKFPEFSDFRDAADRIATNYVGGEKAPERFQGNNWTIMKIQPTKVAGNVD